MHFMSRRVILKEINSTSNYINISIVHLSVISLVAQISCKRKIFLVLKVMPRTVSMALIAKAVCKNLL